MKKLFKYANEGYGYRAIAKKLNTENPNCNFNKSSIEHILKNEVYTGHIIYNRRGGRRNPGKHEDIISSPYDKDMELISNAIWNMNSFLREAKILSKDPRLFTSPFIFKDILICSECGESLKPKNYGPGKKNAYKCPTKENCKSHNILIQSIIEEKVLSSLNSLLSNDSAIESNWTSYKEKFQAKIIEEEKSIKSLEDNYQKCLEYISNIDELIKEPKNEPYLKDFEKYRKHFYDSLLSISKEIEHKKVIIKSTALDLDSFSKSMQNVISTIENKRILIYLLIEKILVSNDNDEIKLNIILNPKITNLENPKKSL